MRPTAGKKKPAIKSGPVKGRYTIHSAHTSIPVEKPVMTYISLDPGGKDKEDDTFSIRLERRHMGTGRYCSLIESMAQNKHALPFDRDILKKDVTKSTLVAIVAALIDSYIDIIGCSPDIALIERQMEANTPMVRLEMILITYFLLRHPTTCVIEISSKLKGQNLGAPDLPHPKLKEWCGQKALWLAEKRGDKAFIAYIRSQTHDEFGKARLKKDVKTDDDTDNLCQIEALCIEVGYQTTDTGVGERRTIDEICLIPTGVVLASKPAGRGRGRGRGNIPTMVRERKAPLRLPDSSSDGDDEEGR